MEPRPRRPDLLHPRLSRAPRIPRRQGRSTASKPPSGPSSRKAGQLVLMNSLGLPTPKPASSTGHLRPRQPREGPPLADCSQAQHRRLRRRRQALRPHLPAPSAAAASAPCDPDALALRPRLHRPRPGVHPRRWTAHIVRVEVLNGKYLYAIKVHITGETFDLCPADICRTSSGVDLDRAACALDAPKSGITVEAYTPATRDHRRRRTHHGRQPTSTSAASSTSPTPALNPASPRSTTSTTSTPCPTSSPTALTSSALTPLPDSSIGSKQRQARPVWSWSDRF